VTQTSGEVVQTTTKLKALYALHPPFRMDSQSASNFYHKFLEEFGPKRTVPIRGSFLVEGGRSSIGQLREKLGAIFAAKIDLLWLTKMIANSYNFRSRMIHGDRQIKSFFRRDEEESKKRLDEEDHSHLFAVGMLPLLLRFVISKDMTELRFKTVFKG